MYGIIHSVHLEVFQLPFLRNSSTMHKARRSLHHAGHIDSSVVQILAKLGIWSRIDNSGQIGLDLCGLAGETFHCIYIWN